MFDIITYLILNTLINYLLYIQDDDKNEDNKENKDKEEEDDDDEVFNYELEKKYPIFEKHFDL